MKNILISGATSYIGLALCAHFIKMGCSVHVVVRPTTNLSRLKLLSTVPNIHIDKGSAQCFANIFKITKPDIVYHLATMYLRKHTPNDIEQMVISNILFGTRLIDAMCNANIPNLIYAGTFGQHYGEHGRESQNLNAATKEAFRSIVNYYIDSNCLKATQITLFDIYGPGDWRSRFINAIWECQKTGSPLLLPSEDLPIDLVYIDDAVSAFVQAGQFLFTNAQNVQKEYCVSSGNQYLLSEVIETFETVVGSQLKKNWGKFTIPERAPKTLWRGEQVPGWKATVPLEEGIYRLIKFKG